MKLYKFILAAVGAAAIGIGIFLACQKELKEVDKNSSKLVQKDNPTQFSFRALLTDNVAIDAVCSYQNDTVHFTYTLCEAVEDDNYYVIIYDPNDEYPITYNEDSTLAYGLNPYDKYFSAWIFRGEPSPGFPPSPSDPGRIIPPTPPVIEMYCECEPFTSGACFRRPFPSIEGLTKYECIYHMGNCKCKGGIQIESAGNYFIGGITSSLIIFQANVIYVNNNEIAKGSYFSLEE